MRQLKMIANKKQNPSHFHALGRTDLPINDKNKKGAQKYA